MCGKTGKNSMHRGSGPRHGEITQQHGILALAAVERTLESAYASLAPFADMLARALER